jgi:hypothetical protein
MFLLLRNLKAHYSAHKNAIIGHVLRRLNSVPTFTNGFSKTNLFVRFEVSTAVTMMIIIFWELTPCGSYTVRIQVLTTSLCNLLALVHPEDGFYESLPVQELTISLCNLPALVHPEDGGDTILRNVGSYKSHTASSPRR